MSGPGRRGAALAGWLAAVLLLAGCGLPMPRGVQEPGAVTAEQREPGAIQVLPPGPRADATAEEVVEGFLRAQSNPEDRHALARQFLAPALRETWNDRAGLVVIEPARRLVSADDQDPSRVVVTEVSVARVGEDGAYRPDSREFRDFYGVARQPTGELLLSVVPPGLRLSREDMDRAVRSYDVFFLSDQGRGPDGRRLVADPVFLPATDDPASAVVTALLAGPSSALRGAARSATSVETRLAGPVQNEDGVVTVDLSDDVRRLPGPERELLSAQLTWTLRGALGQSFVGLRLLAEGSPVSVPGVGTVQDRNAWGQFDPSGLPARAPAFYVADRRLHSLDGGLPTSPVTEGGALPVDEAAARPDGGRLALLTDVGGTRELRTGPPQGPFGEPVLTGPGLTSLSWGSGDDGLWLLRPGADPQVLLVPDDAVPGGPPSSVLVEALEGVGPLTALRVSRDGARVALVFGTGQLRRLHVGRVETVAGWPSITGVRPVVPALYDVTDVAWASGTSLVVLARLGGSGVAPFRVAVDGSGGADPVQLAGLPGAPESLAAAAGRPLVVSVVDEQDRRMLYRDNGASLFRLEGAGSAPFYPG